MTRMPSIEIKDPVIINNIFDTEYFNILSEKLQSLNNSEKFFEYITKRYIISGHQLPILKEAGDILLPIAKKVFNNDKLISYDQICTHYEGEQTNLNKHKDAVPNIYVIDVCMYQKSNWDLIIEDKPYSLNENDGLCFYAGNQIHWREKFPNPEYNIVGMIQFCFAEDGHWVLREKMI